MKAIMVMFDSLNRRLLPNYGCDWVHAPNFQRLAKHTTTFDQSWVCSLPCMPARRDFHTGRPNFLHTGWSPLQPWDDSIPEILNTSGISTHLMTDHYHYFEDGGAGYHNRYSTWQGFRGQEGDPWIGQVEPPRIPKNINQKGRDQDWVNRQFLRSEADFPQTRTFNAGLDFIERNHASDDWFLQIETFDPHEPFVSADAYQSLYPQAGEEPIFDWPGYCKVSESPEEVERVRHNYAALVSQCDANLGRILDAMDRFDLWKDTLLIVWTDHGYLLGEQGQWAKGTPILWSEISHTPFFIWDPRSPQAAGARRASLVQPSIDLGPTLLHYFGLEPTADMTGRDLSSTIAEDTPVRSGAIFGYFGQALHYTDGRTLYVRNVVRPGCGYFEYNSMPGHMRGRWSTKDWLGAELHPPLPFTKGMPVLRRPMVPNAPDRKDELRASPHRFFNLQESAGATVPIDDAFLEKQIAHSLTELLVAAQAPSDLLWRYGLSVDRLPQPRHDRRRGVESQYLTFI